MLDLIRKRLKESADIKMDVLQRGDLLQTLNRMIDESVRCFKEHHRMYLCGNGGSAADAQHIAAELAGRFYRDRRPLPAVALHANSSFLTAVANDYAYDDVFSRATESLGCRGDILVGISASGNSVNVLKALAKAKEIGMVTFGLTGSKGAAMEANCDYLIKVPSDDIPRIQENHITLGHILCEGIESTLF